jgi:hypothetical protein
VGLFRPFIVSDDAPAPPCTETYTPCVTALATTIEWCQRSVKG